jgi:hypothetical protein
MKFGGLSNSLQTPSCLLLETKVWKLDRKDADCTHESPCSDNRSCDNPHQHTHTGIAEIVKQHVLV